ncbi:rhomboid family intramembrane serine protease [Jannaschia sp. LMIT008]|uniref:rhomboid family intramembrane serine protease n=1 Tax=Jannaschia maritima TaxID=3032585 RepID=UPI0028117E03|nr:rhomboid family intramembrane serine protease [Jannaschia sp. LMIT008]
MRTRPPHPTPNAPGPWWILGAVVALCTGLEALAQASELGLTDGRRWRGALIVNLGFWPGLLENWAANYAVQPWSMFVTYAFVHADFWHMAGNMGVLAWLGPPVARAVGTGRLIVLWFLCAAAGGLVFAALASGPTPMVGASGALFGLLGADAALRQRADPNARRVAQAAVLFAVLNVAGYVMQDGLLAWQAHLGGFLAGLALGASMRMRRTP